MEPKTKEGLKLASKALVSPLITAFGTAAGALVGFGGTVLAPVGAVASFGMAAINVIKGDFESAAGLGILGGLCAAFSAASYGTMHLINSYGLYGLFSEANMIVGAAVGTLAALTYCGYQIYDQYQKFKDPDAHVSDEVADDHSVPTCTDEQSCELDQEHLPANGELKKYPYNVVAFRDHFNCNSCGSTDTPIISKNKFGGHDTSCSSCGSDAGGTTVIDLKAA